MIERRFNVYLNDVKSVEELAESYKVLQGQSLSVFALLSDEFRASEDCWKALTADNTPWRMPDGDWTNAHVVYLDPRPEPVTVASPAPKKR